MTAWLFVAPVTFGILLFQLYPILFSLFVSFTRWNLLTPPQWVGLQNYADLFTTDRFFHKAVVNSAIYSLGVVLPGLVLAMVIAILLNQRIRGRFIYRAVYFVPVVAPTVSVAILWTWIYEPSFGVLNYLLGLFGLPGPRWLATSRWAMPAVIIMGIWHGLGYNVVILLAGLQNIPKDYYEAAAVDGASALQRFRDVTFPLLSPVTFFVLVLSTIGAFQAFAAIFVMTGGGPANATLTLVLYLYQSAFQFQEMGTASAVAYCLFAILFALSALSFYLQRVWVVYEES